MLCDSPTKRIVSFIELISSQRLPPNNMSNDSPFANMLINTQRLAGVNFFLACVGSVQVTRSLVYIFTKETGPEEDEQKLDEQDKKE